MAVVGSLAQSKQIHLSKAASIFTRFAAAANATGAPAMHAKATYLRLASSAFDELLQQQNDTGLPEKEKVERKKRGKRSRDEREYCEEESHDDGVVDSHTKRHRTNK